MPQFSPSIQSFFERTVKPLATPPAGWCPSSASKAVESPTEFASAKRLKVSPAAGWAIPSLPPRSSSPKFPADGFTHSQTPVRATGDTAFTSLHSPWALGPLSNQPPPPSSSPSRPGDGFTAEELERSKDPLNGVFNPTREYDKYDISSLPKGPGACNFCGRVVNMSVTHGRSKNESAAKGWINLVVSDGTGAIMVKLYFSPCPPPVILGTLITIWTTFIGAPTAVSKDAQYQHPSCPLSTSIFPGRDASVNAMIHSHSVNEDFARLPLGFNPNTPNVPIPGVMNLKAYIAGGNEVEDAKILVGVKSIGAKKTITTKKDPPTSSDLVEITLYDETAEIRLSLWRETTASAREWRASETILLITRPSFRECINKWGTGKPILGLTSKSMVDVDPSSEWSDANWLRHWLQDQRKSTSVKQVVPDIDIWREDIENPQQALFTIKDIDKWAREEPSRPFAGWVSVIVAKPSLTLARKRNMLTVTECCGIPIYTRVLNTLCKHCDRPLSLVLNPGVVGPLVDESGEIEQGKLIWTETAWEHMWGRSVQELVDMTPKEMTYLESRVACLRVNLHFGWEKGIGKLSVIDVSWPV